MCDDQLWPQQGRERMILAAPVGTMGQRLQDPEPEMLARAAGGSSVFMMGDNPALPRMPKAPSLLDFFTHRLSDVTVKHLLSSAERALQAGLPEKLVLAILLHDISAGGLIRSDHGYWGAQMIAPYVDEEVAWAVQYHQSLRYFADPAAGYEYPDSYNKFFGRDYVPPDYIRRDAEFAQNHHWYMSARTVTLFDFYFFADLPEVDPEIFTDLIGRHFRQPEEGLGFDTSPTAHMWRSMIWPNNFL